MNRIITIISKVFGLLLLMIIVSVGLEFALNLRAERRAQSLLDDVRGLRVGKSTEAEVQQVVERNGGEAGGRISGPCDLDAKPHSIAVYSRALNKMGQIAAALRPFGNRGWIVNVFLVTEGGRLCYASYDLRAFLGGPQALSASAVLQLDSRNSDAFSYVAAAHTLRGLHYIETTWTTNATAEQRERALNLDLSCLTRLGGCRSRCEMAPSAWADYVGKSQENGWT